MFGRFILWRALALLALPLAASVAAWLLDGGPGRLLRGLPAHASRPPSIGALMLRALDAPLGLLWSALPVAGVPLARLLLAVVVALSALLLASRATARNRRRYVRLRVGAYRTDRAGAEAVVAMFEALHKRLLRRWWRRLVGGQPSLGLEVWLARGRDGSADGAPRAWLAVTCPRGLEQMVAAALRSAYPNLRLRAEGALAPLWPPAAGGPRARACLLRLKKRYEFIRRVRVLERLEHEEPPVDRLLTAMAAVGGDVLVQLALTPTPAAFDRVARRLLRRRETRLQREAGGERIWGGERRWGRAAQIDLSDVRGGLELQHRGLFFCDLRVLARDRRAAERVASELRAEGAENRMVERGTSVRQGLGLGLPYQRRLERGEGNPLPSPHRGVLASTELAGFWQLPSVEYALVPFDRHAIPLSPAPPAILRPARVRDLAPEGSGADGASGCLVDELGPVSIHPELRRQNVAVPGTVEQGKTSFLVATVAEDVRRERCAVIVLDPKGDAADAAISVVPPERVCTLLDFAHPTCGFNPLDVAAPADTIADYVVAALRNLFSEGDIRASSDRYLRNAIIAVLAFDRASTLWDAARLLSVGPDGYAYRERVGTRVRALPEYKEISEFFTAELAIQLADARGTTTSKLDAPVNKLARLLNSASIKRVLLNRSLTVDFDAVIAERQVLVVKGALGSMGAGNTAVLMQLLVGMLDAALARQQDSVDPLARVAVALKVDEAPLVINRGFADTMALKRSAGLETVACWQTDAQWEERELREQLDALFAHRVYFATASARDARAAAGLMMSEFSDQLRVGHSGSIHRLARPDVRMHLPKHYAIASWTTPRGRQSPFIARTLPLRVDGERIEHQRRRQLERGGCFLEDLSQPHWDRLRPGEASGPGGGEAAVASAPAPMAAAPAASVPAPAAPAAVTPAASLPAAAAAGVAPASAGLPADGYRELALVDGAQSVRWLAPPDSPRDHDPDDTDRAILELIGRHGHVLSTQIHRRLLAGRAQTTTQRRLKRLADAGLVVRFQFHRADGGGVPMCYSLAAAGRRLLEPDAEEAPSPRADARQMLRRARRDIHVAAWVMALQDLRPALVVEVRGRDAAVLEPSIKRPDELRLESGRSPHDFLRSHADGTRRAVERFDSVRPDIALELRLPTPQPSIVELLLEFDMRRAGAGGPERLERYDHLLTGWALQEPRRSRRLAEPPLVVLVHRDVATAREACRLADPIVVACRAYAGEHPTEWRYTGRERLRFAAERDVHEGSLRCFALPALPPELRVAAAGGDPSARACEPMAACVLPTSVLGATGFAA